LYIYIFFVDIYWAQGSSHALFFYTGNEAPIEQFWDNSGFVFEAAAECNALVVFGEHVSNTVHCGRVFIIFSKATKL